MSEALPGMSKSSQPLGLVHTRFSSETLHPSCHHVASSFLPQSHLTYRQVLKAPTCRTDPETGSLDPPPQNDHLVCLVSPAPPPGHPQRRRGVLRGSEQVWQVLYSELLVVLFQLFLTLSPQVSSGSVLTSVPFSPFPLFQPHCSPPTPGLSWSSYLEKHAQLLTAPSPSGPYSGSRPG